MSDYQLFGVLMLGIVTIELIIFVIFLVRRDRK